MTERAALLVVLMLLFATLQTADGVLTYVGLKQGAGEVNPLARKLFGAIGIVPALIAMKLGAVVIVGGLVLNFDDTWARIPGGQLGLLVIVNLWAAWVAFNNIRAIR